MPMRCSTLFIIGVIYQTTEESKRLKFCVASLSNSFMWAKTVFPGGRIFKERRHHLFSLIRRMTWRLIMEKIVVCNGRATKYI